MTLKILYESGIISVPTYRCARTPANPSTAIRFSYRAPFSSSSPCATRLCLNESLADLGAALAGGQMGLLEGRGTLLDLLIGLGEDELDVAGVGHVRVDLKTLLGCGVVETQG